MLSILFIATPILLFLLSLYCRINIKRNYLFWIFFAIFSSLFYFIPAINYGASGFTRVLFESSSQPHMDDVNSVMELYIFQTLFYLLFLAGYKMVNPVKKTQQSNNVPMNNLGKIALISSIISLIGTFGNIYFSGMSIHQLMDSSRFDYWQTKSTAPYLISNYLQALLAISAFLFPYIKKRYIKVVTIISLIALFVVDMMIFGSRSTFLAIGAAYLFGKISSKKSKIKKLKIGRYMILGLPLLHIAIIWQYVRYISRSLHTAGDWIKTVLNFKEAYTISLSNGDLNYFFGAGLASLHYVPSIHDFLYGSTYIRVLLFFLPSSLVPFKPEETQRIFAGIINPQAYNIGATFPPSFIGDSYINFGFFGIVVGLFLGLLLKTWQNTLNGPLSINKITIGSTGFLFLFLFIRGTFNGMFNLIFAWIFLTGIMFFLRSSKAKKSFNNSAVKMSQ